MMVKSNHFFPKNFLQAFVLAMAMTLILATSFITIGFVLKRGHLILNEDGLLHFISGLIGFTVIILLLVYFFKFNLKSLTQNIGSHKRLIIPTIIFFIFLKMGILQPIYYLIAEDSFRGIHLEPSLKSSLAVLSLVLIAPIFEEYIYRGFILKRLLKSKSVVYSIVVSSFIFGIIHFTPAKIVIAFIVGLIAATLYYYTKDILLCIIIHFISNMFVSFFHVFYEKMGIWQVDTVFELYGEYTSLIIIFSVAVNVLLCFYFVKEFKSISVKK